MSDIKFRLLHDLVAIKADEEVEVSKGGIHLGVNTEKPLSGTAVAVGPGRHIEQTGEFIETTVKPGDKVFYTKGGNEVELDGEKYLLISEMNILGINT